MLICLACVAVSPVDKVYANCLSLRTTLFIFFPPHVPLTHENKTTRQFMRRSCAEATARPDRKISRIDSMMRTHSKPRCTYRKDVSAWHQSNSTLQWNIFQSLFWDHDVFSWHRGKVGQIPHLASCPLRLNTQRRCFKLLLSLMLWAAH